VKTDEEASAPSVPAVRAALSRGGRARCLVHRLVESRLARFLAGAVASISGCEQRAAGLAHASIKTASKLRAIRPRHLDDRPHRARGRRHGQGKVRQLCARPSARSRPTSPCRRSRPSACTPTSVATAVHALRGMLGPRSASVATAFPSGRASLAVKARRRPRRGRGRRHEVDMVIDAARSCRARWARSQRRSLRSRPRAARRH